MSDLQELYQEVILDHNRHPRNFHRLAGADRIANGDNPLCGDQISLYLKLSGNKLEDVSFEGTGCAISIASASLMTEAIRNKTCDEAKLLLEQFRKLVMGEEVAIANNLGKLAVFAGVSEFPVRVKCATLAWHTLNAALENRIAAPVTTE
ncbi:MAG: SUF system NifU family Fe-S cluster assembly protein [Cyanobacteria bacterium NC_groundwater_1444_Ag_S-0.65um_54_12]|nr:SUF system NifU family Fe-S cluster assembly protein [Cyanobacteria bacterium NC_groundwater_1444_Ag_S-0.65um_54_12]